MQWDNVDQPGFESGVQRYFMNTYRLIDAVLNGASEVAVSAEPSGQLPFVFEYHYAPLCLTISVFQAVKAMWPTMTSDEQLQATIRQLAFHRTIPYLQGHRMGWYTSPDKTKRISATLITYLLSRPPSR